MRVKPWAMLRRMMGRLYPGSRCAPMCPAVLLALVLLMHEAIAATPSNLTSPLGINLAGVNYFSSEQPLLNIFLTNGGWITHSDNKWDTTEESSLQLDANGYPTTLKAKATDSNSPQLFNSVGVILERQGGQYPYPAGQYVVLYDGGGRLAYGADASLVSSAPGRDVINVARPSDGGIDLRIIATDPKHDGNYIRNIRLVQLQNEAALKAGQVFAPAFLAMLKNFRVLRFMDWLQTNGSTLASWSNRPLPSSAAWGMEKGVPIEVTVQLANAVSADPWLNIPAMADDDYITQMAVLVHKQLGAGQKVYVEYSNEVWNGTFSQYAYAGTRGQALWPDRPSGGGNFEWNRNWYGMRTAQTCDIWRAVWGVDARRVVCVLAAQAANAYTATDALECKYWTAGAPCANHGIRVVAIAPYFGDATHPEKWKLGKDGGADSLFESLTSTDDPAVAAGGWFNAMAQWETAYVAALSKYHLRMVAYEGGQGFIGGEDASVTNMVAAANRDSRMGVAYTKFLQQWKANGGELFVIYNDVGGYSKYGEWGALESLMQLTDPHAAPPPKWQAIQDFISRTPCWWPGCSGVTTAGAASSAPGQSAHQ
jgi:hypothetical protein